MPEGRVSGSTSSEGRRESSGLPWLCELEPEEGPK
jgi:hypothetical protein